MIDIQGNGWMFRSSVIGWFKLEFGSAEHDTVFSADDIGLKDSSDVRGFFIRNRGLDAASLITTLNNMSAAKEAASP